MKPWKTERAGRRDLIVAALALSLGAIALGGRDTAIAESPANAARSFSPEGFSRVGDYIRKDAASYSTRIGAFRLPGCS